MTAMKKLRILIHNLLLHKRMESELDAEVHSYSAMLTEEKMSKGMKPNEARRAARMESGGAELLKEEVRSARVGAWIESLWQDFHYAARMLRRNPGFTAVAVLTLALGIGANSAIFSMVNAVLLRPLPYSDSSSLVMVWATDRRNGLMEDVASYPDFEDWKSQAKSFEGLAAITSRSSAVSNGDDTEILPSIQATPELFGILQVFPQLGRVFLPGENEPGAPRVALLSDSFWKERFAGRPDVLGQTLRVNEFTYRIVGVMRPGLRISPGKPEQIYVPLVRDPNRSHGFLRVIGRIRKGFTIAQAQSEMDIIAGRLAEQYPKFDKGIGANVMPLVTATAGQIRDGLLIFLGVVTLVLLIACANVANLMLARSVSRQKELAVRVALGAGRRRIVQQLLTESAVLALAGGALGLLLSNWLARAFAAMMATNFEVPRISDTGLDSNVLLFTLLVSLATGIVFGIAPALSAASQDLNDNLRESGRSAAGGWHGKRLRGALVIGETALALVLLAGAGILLKGILVMRGTAPGFDTTNLVTVEFRLPPTKFSSPVESQAYFQNILARTNSVPGVRSAALVADLPLGGGHDSLGFHIPGRPDPQAGKPFSSSFNIVSAGYFRTMGTPLIAGREFTAEDSGNTPPVIIINETAARSFWPGENPIGKQITLPSHSDPITQVVLTVIGEVRDVHQSDLGTAPTAEISLHYMQPGPSWSWLVLVVRTMSDPSAMTGAIKTAASLADREVPISRISTMDEILAGSMAEPRAYTLLLGIFASLALALAAVGLYGVVSYTVTQRTHEMGIRVALGAARGDIARLVLRQGMILSLSGIALGLIGAVAVARLLTHLVRSIEPNDPVTLISVGGVLLFVALLASYLPARRAMRVDPMVALRYE